MKNYLKLIVLTFILFIGEGALAAVETPPATITEIATAWYGEGVFIYTSDSNTYNGCSQPRYFVNVNNPMFDEMLSLALSAFHSKTPVRLWVPNCSGADMQANSVKLVQ